ncbi:hypothetical protein DL770_011096 [Monosporascus sp. CRB-9-2]|nr:hypothetical protein DL770_011096 [Monosporascus sp. CRB-9-2]
MQRLFRAIGLELDEELVIQVDNRQTIRLVTEEAEDELATQEDKQGNREEQRAKEKKKETVKKLKEALLPIKRLVQKVT